MGDIIGESAYPTWARLRIAPSTNNSGNPGYGGGQYNLEYPAGNYFLRTIEGNGFVRPLGNATTGPGFQLLKSNPEDPGFFYSTGFVEPNNDTLLGKLVSMTDGSFEIEPEAFTDGQNVGTEPKLPFTGVELFDFLT
jgi:hypothetical protein